MKYFFFFLFFTALLEAQILNVDRITQTDSITSKWAGFTDVSFSSDKLKNNVLDGSAKFELNHFFENKYFIVGLLNNDFTLNGKEVIQNEGFIQIRYRDMDTREWSTEAFVQYQWNGALGMEYRKVIGTNVRKRFFKKKKLDLYAGLGVFHESEQWNWSGVTNYEQLEATPTLNRSLFRLNNYWKIAYKINENVDISAISYFQMKYFIKSSDTAIDIQLRSFKDDKTLLDKNFSEIKVSNVGGVKIVGNIDLSKFEKFKKK